MGPLCPRTHHRPCTGEYVSGQERRVGIPDPPCPDGPFLLRAPPVLRSFLDKLSCISVHWRPLVSVVRRLAVKQRCMPSDYFADNLAGMIWDCRLLAIGLALSFTGLACSRTPMDEQQVMNTISPGGGTSTVTSGGAGGGGTAGTTGGSSGTTGNGGVVGGSGTSFGSGFGGSGNGGVERQFSRRPRE